MHRLHMCMYDYMFETLHKKGITMLHTWPLNQAKKSFSLLSSRSSMWLRKKSWRGSGDAARRVWRCRSINNKEQNKWCTKQRRLAGSWSINSACTPDTGISALLCLVGGQAFSFVDPAVVCIPCTVLLLVDSSGNTLQMMNTIIVDLQ